MMFLPASLDNFTIAQEIVGVHEFNQVDKPIFLPYGERDLIIGEDDMEKFNGMPIYWLGHSIGKLMDELTPSSTVGSIANSAMNLRSNIELFMYVIQGFPLSKAAAMEITGNINNILSPERLQQPNDHILESEQGTLNINIYSFQAVFYSEFSQANIFYVTQKRAYDMTVLINQGQNVLSRETLSLLASSKNEVINDIREATKSLAFDIPTAVGFHVYRAIEAIVVREYFPVLNIQSKEWERNKNLGHYIGLLEKAKVEPKVTTMLRHLKDHYRNPISHPEEFWDSDKAESAFMLAVSVITVMIQDIKEIKEKVSP